MCSLSGEKRYVANRQQKGRMVQFSMYYCVADMKCNPHYVVIRFIYLFVYDSKVFVTWSVEKTGFQLVVYSAIFLVA